MDDRLDRLLSDIADEANARVGYASMRDNIEEEHNRVRQRRRNNIVRRLSVAAMFVLLVGIGAIYLQKSGTMEFGRVNENRFVNTSREPTPVAGLKDGDSAGEELTAPEDVISQSPDDSGGQDVNLPEATSSISEGLNFNTRNFSVHSVQFAGDLINLLPAWLNGAQRIDDQDGIFMYQYENGARYVVKMTDFDMTGGIPVGEAAVSRMGEGEYIALWRISENYNITISAQNITENDMTAFLDAIARAVIN